MFKDSLKNGLLVSEFKSFGVSGLVKSYDYTDLLLGLYDIYMNSKNEDDKKYLIHTADLSIKIFNFENNIKSYYSPLLHFGLPLFDTRDGTFIEFFCELYDLTKNDKYLKVAKNIYKKIIDGDFYKKHNILPTFDSPRVFKFLSRYAIDNSKFNSGAIIKNNTNSLFGFLSIAKYGEPGALVEIWKIVESIFSIVDKTDGGVPLVFDPLNTAKYSSLSATFPVIDFLCDLYDYKSEKRAIILAKKLADFWLTKQGKTGLFPHESDKNDSFFDAETDMSVSLYKLWEKTGESKYKEAADFCVNGIFKYHGTKDYVLCVDINSGEVTNNAQRTKFIALFLKLLILRIEYSKGSKIYSHKHLFDLLRDR